MAESEEIKYKIISACIPNIEKIHFCSWKKGFETVLNQENFQKASCTSFDHIRPLFKIW